MADILVIDDEAIVREPIAGSLRAHGHRVHSAGSGAEALEHVRQHTPDLILLDINMPQRDGISLLKAFREDRATAAVPVVLLSSSTDKTVILKAAKLGIQGYILKSAFSLRELLARIDTLVPRQAAPSPPPPPPLPAPSSRSPSNSPLPTAVPPSSARPSLATASASTPSAQALTRDDCIRRVKEAIGTKTLGGVAPQVIAMATSPTTDLSELGGLISRDPVLSARVLQVANSPAFATSGRMILTIQDAVRQIGVSAIRDVAAAMGVFDAIPRSDGAGFNPLRCWRHSLAVAQLAQYLAAAVDPSKAGLAYLIGLCHDLGEILLHTCFEAEFAQIHQSHALTHEPLPEMERKMFGARPSELADILLIHLGLPPVIRSPIEVFHRHGASSRWENCDSLGKILQLADHYANGLLLASNGSSPVTLLTNTDMRDLFKEEPPPVPDRQVLRSNVTVLTGMLARLAPDALERLLQPLHPKAAGVSVYVARHPAISPWDAVAAALDGMAERVQLADHLPDAQEAAGFSHLVVLAPAVTAQGFSAGAVEAAATHFAGIFWLVNAHDAKATAGGALTPAQAPVTLDQLHAFFDTAPQTEN
jgi:CheY-like chemotaxis protein/HD-like signal output (HDOD) protein